MVEDKQEGKKGNPDIVLDLFRKTEDRVDISDVDLFVAKSSEAKYRTALEESLTVIKQLKKELEKLSDGGALKKAEKDLVAKKAELKVVESRFTAFFEAVAKKHREWIAKSESGGGGLTTTEVNSFFSEVGDIIKNTEAP